MGMIVSVYRDASDDCDCTLNGVTARHTRLTIVNIPGPFDPREDRPAVLLMPGNRPGVPFLQPAFYDEVRKEWLPCEGWYMFGGNFASTSDSRFGDAVKRVKGSAFYGAIPVHDRCESWN